MKRKYAVCEKFINKPEGGVICANCGKHMLNHVTTITITSVKELRKLGKKIGALPIRMDK